LPQAKVAPANQALNKGHPMKINQKILFYMLPLVVLPLMLLGAFSFFSAKNNTEQQAKTRINSHLQQNLQQIQSYYQGIESTLNLLSQSKPVEQYLNADANKLLAQPQKLQPNHALMDSFSGYAASYLDFYEVRLLSPTGMEEVRFSTQSATNVFEDESQTDYFSRIKSMTDPQGMFLIINPDNDEIALLAAKKLYRHAVDDGTSPDFAGYLIFTVRPSMVIEAVNREFGASGVNFVTNERGIVLFAAQSYLQGTVLPISLFGQLKAIVGSDELADVNYKNVVMRFGGTRLPNGYLLFNGIAKDEILADRQHLGLVSVVSTLVVMIGVPFLLYFFLRRLVLLPISELIMAKQAVGKGNFDVYLDSHQSDEIGELYSSFNVMVRQLKAYQQRESDNKLHLEDQIIGRTKVLKEANRELENTNQALEAARTTAEQANELKSSFLANMSHEIRTPLTAIIGFTEEAIKVRNPKDAQCDYLQRVLRSSEHLSHLINEILDLSKIEADKLELEHKPINLFELLTDIEQLNVPLAQQESLHFKTSYDYPLPQVFNGDSTRLRQVLVNLCTNAVKFTVDGSVTLTVSFLKNSGELRFSVQDSGIGMSDQEMERLFEPFVQANASIARKFGGSGLGLVISKKLIQLMLGRLEVESIKGLGSRFDVIIPAGIATLNMVGSMPLNKVVEQSKSEQVSLLVNAHVLVAQGNVDNQYLIEPLLRRFGVSYDIVDNGAQAVESAMCENYDLILMDIQMPEMGGVEAVELLRQSCIDCPIIALTANIMKEEIDYYLKSGFDGTLAKPIAQDCLFETINHHLQAGCESGNAMNQLVADLAEDSEIKLLKDNFKAGLPALIADFKRYVGADDWQGMKNHAHMIRGSAGSLGYPQLTEFSGKIEGHVKSGDNAKAKEAAEQFIEACEECVIKTTDLLID
jgi:signal transduction histidine kinase/DNA-binding NarL/FixJ family response regulator